MMMPLATLSKVVRGGKTTNNNLRTPPMVDGRAIATNAAVHVGYWPTLNPHRRTYPQCGN